jgi:hypothetical protein
MLLIDATPQGYKESGSFRFRTQSTRELVASGRRCRTAYVGSKINCTSTTQR